MPNNSVIFVFFQKMSLEENGSKSSKLNATIKKDLECPVCLNVPNTGPIFQCHNGHLICSPCRKRVTTCPVCRIPLGYTRNLTSEKMIALLSQSKNEDTPN